MWLVRSITMSLVSLLLMISLISGNAFAVNNMKSFLGLGPIFSTGAAGYVSSGLEFPIERWGDFTLSAGPWVGFYFSRGSIGSDLDGMLKGYYHIQLNHKYSLGITAKLPVGLTLGGVDVPGFGYHFQPGFNIGLIPGVEFFFHRSFGVYAELGFFHHSFFPTAKYLTNNHHPMGIFLAGAVYKF